MNSAEGLARYRAYLEAWDKPFGQKVGPGSDMIRPCIKCGRQGDHTCTGGIRVSHDAPIRPMDATAAGRCLACGADAILSPGRRNGVPVYCASCATPLRPVAIGIRAEHAMTDPELDSRGIDDLPAYHRRTR